MAHEPPICDLVTVVIPAFNAAETIDETLHSVRAQTYRCLEIIVVDDGSIDQTAEIVQQHIVRDQRIRLIKQENSGVAAARNRGISEAMGDYVAPIDADDLWQPEKIEKQMAALHHAGEAVGLVYTWSARIDASSRALGRAGNARHAGRVAYEIARTNFIGNGSAVLMRKAAVQEVGGYDPSLRARSAEGLEDWLLYFRIAARYQFAVVPEYLTGYRFLPTSMSANVPRMLKGFDIVMGEICKIYPEWSKDILDNRTVFLTTYLYPNALRAMDPLRALATARLALRENAFKSTRQLTRITLRALYWLVRNRWRNLFPQRFNSYSS
jgi:glycosyltransferase involved in cell wall biosynthesis